MIRSLRHLVQLALVVASLVAALLLASCGGTDREDRLFLAIHTVGATGDIVCLTNMFGRDGSYSSVHFTWDEEQGRHVSDDFWKGGPRAFSWGEFGKCTNPDGSPVIITGITVNVKLQNEGVWVLTQSYPEAVSEPTAGMVQVHIIRAAGMPTIAFKIPK